MVPKYDKVIKCCKYYEVTDKVCKSTMETEQAKICWDLAGRPDFKSLGIPGGP